MHIHNNIVSWELKKTCSGGGKSFEDTDGGAPSGTLTQFKKPASSIASLSISPSTYNVKSIC